MTDQGRLLQQSSTVTVPTSLNYKTLFLIILLLYVRDISGTTNKDDKAAELESLRIQIKDVKSDLDESLIESERLHEELREMEIAASKESLKIQGIEEQIDTKQKKVKNLNKIISENQKALESERRHLARQIRSAYMTGRSDYLKLMLNQEEPALVGRALAYHDYINRLRIQSIHAIREKIDLIDEYSVTLNAETEAFKKLKERQLERSRELESFRNSRQEILARLQDHIIEKDLELKSLQNNERKLSVLLEELEVKDDRDVFYEDILPFKSLKGKLSWPVEGKLLNRFGSDRRGAALKWNGVQIGADAGKEVHAVHTGKVIFADWFRNLGQLIILDHGGGYMSLYGYNQNLLKKPGDWVLAGETVALTGDTGGQKHSGVYFEIRHHGKPLNPIQWCKR